MKDVAFVIGVALLAVPLCAGFVVLCVAYPWAIIGGIGYGYLISRLLSWSAAP